MGIDIGVIWLWVDLRMLNGQRELVMALWKLGEGVEAYSMGGDDGGAMEWLVLEDGVGWVKAMGLGNGE
ncbi:hypothetical protein V6N11_077502 [Hibiscus sabdariffa]|uniref:Uncharacterized protein n=1 Tax=Hibiscus sabdariffa TaxID=183260 RepID=A0ABR2TDL6_9ROSI